MPEAQGEDSFSWHAQMAGGCFELVVFLYPIPNREAKGAFETWRDLKALLKPLSYVASSKQMVNRFITFVAHGAYRVKV